MEPSNQDMPKIIKFLKDDGYEFQKIDFDPRYGGSARAIFEKMAHIAELDGNDINDATINVTVDFSTGFDYKTGVINEDEGIVEYPDYSKEAGETFIRKLMDGTYGGGRRRKSRRKTRKNRRGRKY